MKDDSGIGKMVIPEWQGYYLEAAEQHRRNPHVLCKLYATLKEENKILVERIKAFAESNPQDGMDEFIRLREQLTEN